MHPLRQIVEAAVAQVVLMCRHEYAWHCLKALAQTNTVSSQWIHKASFVFAYFQL